MLEGVWTVCLAAKHRNIRALLGNATAPVSHAEEQALHVINCTWFEPYGDLLQVRSAV